MLPTNDFLNLIFPYLLSCDEFYLFNKPAMSRTLNLKTSQPAGLVYDLLQRYIDTCSIPYRLKEPRLGPASIGSAQAQSDQDVVMLQIRP